MNIAYHRISGAVGLTTAEKGTRGAWVEKRVNTLGWLIARDHEVGVLSRLTKLTNADRPSHLKYPTSVRNALVTADLLMLEFGPSNGMWYAEDYELTRAITSEFTGPIVYLCDDPDLLKQSICRYVPQANWSRWTFLLNCQQPEKAPQVLGAPAEAQYGEFNPSAGMPMMPYAPSSIPLLVYPGRPGGRKEQCCVMNSSEVVQMVGSPSDWKGYDLVHPLLPSPQQAQRRQFYRQYAGLVCAFDDAHAELGWRTGRAYHALSAGVPVLAFDGNAALWWTQRVSDAGSIADAWAMLSEDDAWRISMVEQQRFSVSNDETTIFSAPVASALGL